MNVYFLLSKLKIKIIISEKGANKLIIFCANFVQIKNKGFGKSTKTLIYVVGCAGIEPVTSCV